MKRIVLTIVVLSIVVVKLYAQSIAIGLRDNQFAKIGYVFKHNYTIGYEQSLLNVKLKEQSGRMFAGYQYINGNWLFSGLLYFGGEYSGNWKVYGGNVSTSFYYKRLALSGTLNPNYDTGMAFQFNYDVAASFNLWLAKDALGERVGATISYGNIPEFRDNVDNLRIGLKFECGKLWVHPEIAFPNVGGENKHIRVLCNLGFLIPL